MRHPILNGPLALACNTACSYDDLTSAEYLVHFCDGLRDVLDHTDDRELGIVG